MRLEQVLQDESDLVLRSLRAALTALEHGDAELAEEVIRFDDEVDARYLGIENGIQNLLATQTPVATDLRLVLAILHTNLHLERCADYCVTIAKLIKLTADLPGEQGLIEAFEEMGLRAEQMLRVAVDSFAARDAVRAETLVELDELIDRANRRAMEQVFAIADDLDKRRWGLRMLIVSRCLERIGDLSRRHRRADRLPRHRGVPRVHGCVAAESHGRLSAIASDRWRPRPAAYGSAFTRSWSSSRQRFSAWASSSFAPSRPRPARSSRRISSSPTR